MRTITVQRTKKSRRKILATKTQRYFPEMYAFISQHDESRVLCFSVLKEIIFIKVIINSDCFSQHRSLKSALKYLTKASKFFLMLFKLFIMSNRVSP